MELAVDIERRHVFLNVEGMGHVGGIEDEVEFEGPRLGPVLLACEDEFFGTHLLGIRFFVRAVREGVDFSAESTGPQDTEMAESTTAGY